MISVTVFMGRSLLFCNTDNTTKVRNYPVLFFGFNIKLRCMISCGAERGNFGDLGFAEQAQRLQKPKQSDTVSEGRKLG